MPKKKHSGHYCKICGQMVKLLKWIVHTLEIFMWPQDYGLRGTGGPFLEMSQDPFDDSDGEDWTDTMEDTGQRNCTLSWQNILKQKRRNGSESKAVVFPDYH